MLASHYALVAGSGSASTILNAFDRALQSAGVGNYNLVKVTSILPPLTKPGDFHKIPPGSVVFAAMASMTSEQPGTIISAAIAIGLPRDRSLPGVIMEGNFFADKETAERKVHQMAEVALKDRGYNEYDIESIAVSYSVKDCGAVIALCLLW